MRLAILVTLMAAALAGCGVRVHYTARGYAYGYGHYYGYSTSYGSTGVVWNAPPPQPVIVGAPPPPAGPATVVVRGDVEVVGSDGSYGWMRACDADVEIHRLSEQMARKGCAFESYGYDETRAVCGGVRVALRRDATHVYRLCPPGADRAQCGGAWGAVLAP